MPEANILVVDDDASIREALSEYLSGHGFRVRVAANAVEMDDVLRASVPDLVLLDLMMPGEDGLSVCRRLGTHGIPVLMLSALGTTTDRIIGLEVGADDYLAKPFEPRELLARVRALLRRREVATAPSAILRFANSQFDMDSRRLTTLEGVGCVILTPGETMLLRAFAERPGRLLSRDQLIDLTRGDDSDAFDRAIDLAVSRLRRKLGTLDSATFIETVRGEGYRFIPKVRRA